MILLLDNVIIGVRTKVALNILLWDSVNFISIKLYFLKSFNSSTL